MLQITETSCITPRSTIRYNVIGPRRCQFSRNEFYHYCGSCYARNLNVKGSSITSVFQFSQGGIQCNRTIAVWIFANEFHNHCGSYFAQNSTSRVKTRKGVAPLLDARNRWQNFVWGAYLVIRPGRCTLFQKRVLSLLRVVFCTKLRRGRENVRTRRITTRWKILLAKHRHTM
jgi:hypothetical protein